MRGELGAGQVIGPRPRLKACRGRAPRGDGGAHRGDGGRGGGEERAAQEIAPSAWTSASGAGRGNARGFRRRPWRGSSSKVYEARLILVKSNIDGLIYGRTVPPWPYAHPPLSTPPQRQTPPSDDIFDSSARAKTSARPATRCSRWPTVRVKILCLVGNQEAVGPRDRRGGGHLPDERLPALAILRDQGCCRRARRPTRSLPDRGSGVLRDDLAHGARSSAALGLVHRPAASLSLARDSTSGHMRRVSRFKQRRARS